MKWDIDNSWDSFFKQECEQDYFLKIQNFLKTERGNGKNIFPIESEIFTFLKLCSLEKCKVIILGQDPYHQKNQAHGLAFSINKQNKIPPSLKNIFKELNNDLGIKTPTHGNLSQWASQGVMLLNTILTVEENKPLSHANIGWEVFTDHLLNYINKNKRDTVFVLWGEQAKKKIKLLDINKNNIIYTSHPSPLSAYRGFLGSKIFSKINNLLIEINIEPIDWSLENSTI